jgi:hypothetical protein
MANKKLMYLALALLTAAPALANVLPAPLHLSAPSGAGALALDDAAPVSAFLQVAPVPGAVPSRRTELRLAHDGKALHIRVRAYDPEPAAIVARQMRRDVEGMLEEDQVTLVFDPEGDGRNGYMFAVNPNGAQFDALIFDGGQMRFDWDALWRSEARIEADGWSADITIPLSVFGRGRAPGEGELRTWRVNAERWMPRGSERVRLAAIQPDKEVYSLGDALPMPAIIAGQDGWGLRVKGSLRATADSAAATGTGRSRRRLEPGVELFHESEGGLRTTAAVNIDFGEAEADERAVNLTRFELFRPEKREFFLHDAGRYTFGGLVDGAVIPYYSRRVGLDATGRARSLDAGLKFSGQVGGADFGLLGARVAGGPTEPGQPDQQAAEVAVLRLAKPLNSRNRIGMMATQGNSQGTGGSSVRGVDYQYLDSNWTPPGGEGGKTLEANAWMLESRNTGLDSGRAWGASINYPNVGLNGRAELQRIGEDFNPALGYLAEAGVTRGEGNLGWWHRTAGGDNIFPGMDWNFRRKRDGSESSLLLNPEIEYSTGAGDVVLGEMFYERDRLAAAYEPVPGVVVAPGSYSWNYLFGYAETSPSRPVSAQAELRSGGYYNGNRNDQNLYVSWKPSQYWGWRVGVNRNAIRLPSGRFTVRMATLRLDHTPTTRMAESLLLQWDNVSQELGVSARMRWWWAADRELIFSLDRLGYTGERREVLPNETRAMLKLVWNLER